MTCVSALRLISCVSAALTLRLITCVSAAPAAAAPARLPEADRRHVRPDQGRALLLNLEPRVECYKSLHALNTSPPWARIEFTPCDAMYVQIKVEHPVASVPEARGFKVENPIAIASVPEAVELCTRSYGHSLW